MAKADKKPPKDKDKKDKKDKKKNAVPKLTVVRMKSRVSREGTIITERLE